MKAPTFELTGTGVLALGAVGAVGLLGLWLYSKKDDLAEAAETALARVNAIGGAITGDENFSLGGAVYDATHGGALDVRSAENLAYRGVNSIGEAVTGDKAWSLGGAIYDLFNPAPPPAVAPSTYGQRP
jgi:hypothetical protein